MSALAGLAMLRLQLFTAAQRLQGDELEELRLLVRDVARLVEVDGSAHRVAELERDLEASRATARQEIERQRQILQQNNEDWRGIRAELEDARQRLAQIEIKLRCSCAEVR